MSAPTDSQVRPGRAATVTLLLASSLTIMSGATISPALPSIEAHFAHTENAALLTRLVLTLPAIFIVVSSPLAGRIADTWGRQRLLLVSALLYGFSGMSGLFAGSLIGLLAGRALLGIAVAGIMTATTALASDFFAGQARDRFMGLQIALNGLSGLVFLIAGGFLADLDWRAPFAIYGAAFLLLPGILLYLASGHDAAAGKAGAGSAAAAAIPWLPFAGLCVIAFLNFVSFYLIPTQLPYLLREIGIASPGWAGIAVGLSPLTGSVTSLSFGRLKPRFGSAALFSVGFITMAAGQAIIGISGNYGGILAGVAVSGFGMGLVMPNFVASAMALASPANRGRVAGLLSSAIFSGQFASPLISQPVIAEFGIPAVFLLSSAMLALVATAIVAKLLRRAWIPA